MPIWVLYRTLQNKLINSSWVSHSAGLLGPWQLSIPTQGVQPCLHRQVIHLNRAAKWEWGLNEGPADQRSKQCSSKHPLVNNTKAKHRTRSWSEGCRSCRNWRRCNEMWSMKSSVDLMHCLDTSLIEEEITCFGTRPACGWHHLALWHCSPRSWPSWQPRCMIQVSECSRGDLLLFTSEETPLPKECLCLWAPWLALDPCLWHVALFPFL